MCPCLCTMTSVRVAEPPFPSREPPFLGQPPQPRTKLQTDMHATGTTPLFSPTRTCSEFYRPNSQFSICNLLLILFGWPVSCDPLFWRLKYRTAKTEIGLLPAAAAIDLQAHPTDCQKDDTAMASHSCFHFLSDVHCRA